MTSLSTAARFRYVELADPDSGKKDAEDVVRGLTSTPKTLPSRFFYDSYGSQLFERICELPEYYPTRTEEAILADAAPAIARATGPCEIVELGSGSAKKTPMLLKAYADTGHPLHYVPVDVNGEMVRESALRLLSSFSDLHVAGIGGTYEQALTHLNPAQLPRRMVVFLGSTIGNFLPSQLDRFLGRLGEALEPGDYFLAGIDLQKDVRVLEAAYNDSRGVTAQFNLNILRHLNRRFRGDFVLRNFRHHAFYDREHHRIEMHLRTQGDQTVSLAALNLKVSFADGETVRTEVSHKFDPDQLAAQVSRHGFAPAGRWTDERGWFALSLFRRMRA